MEKFSPFTRMLLGALLGIILGIIFGLIFSLLIVWIVGEVRIVLGLLNEGPTNKDMYVPASFLGMGFGAVVGAILGAVYSNKR